MKSKYCKSTDIKMSGFLRQRVWIKKYFSGGIKLGINKWNYSICRINLNMIRNKNRQTWNKIRSNHNIKIDLENKSWNKMKIIPLKKCVREIKCIWTKKVKTNTQRVRKTHWVSFNREILVQQSLFLFDDLNQMKFNTSM